jgi:hypothetical protein
MNPLHLDVFTGNEPSKEQNTIEWSLKIIPLALTLLTAMTYVLGAWAEQQRRVLLGLDLLTGPTSDQYVSIGVPIIILCGIFIPVLGLLVIYVGRKITGKRGRSLAALLGMPGYLVILSFGVFIVSAQAAGYLGRLRAIIQPMLVVTVSGSAMPFKEGHELLVLGSDDSRLAVLTHANAMKWKQDRQVLPTYILRKEVENISVMRRASLYAFAHRE